MQRLPFVLKGLEGSEYPRDPFALMAATRNWYQCPVFNRSRIVACDFDETWRTIHGLDLDSRYLGPSKCRSSTKYLTPLIPVDSSIRCALELYQVKKTKLFFCCLIWTFLGITGKSENKKRKMQKRECYLGLCVNMYNSRWKVWSTVSNFKLR